MPHAEYVSASAAAAALEIPAEQCQLLLYTLAAVGGKAGAAAAAAAGRSPEEGGTSIFDLSLFLMAQLYNREAQKHETQDHWPDPSSSGAAQQQDAFKAAGARAVQPGTATLLQFYINRCCPALAVVVWLDVSCDAWWQLVSVCIGLSVSACT